MNFRHSTSFPPSTSVWTDDPVAFSNVLPLYDLELGCEKDGGTLYVIASIMNIH